MLDLAKSHWKILLKAVWTAAGNGQKGIAKSLGKPKGYRKAGRKCPNITDTVPVGKTFLLAACDENSGNQAR